MTIIDARNFIEDPSAKPFIQDFRVDLLASDVPTESTGRYIVCKMPTPKGQVNLVKGFVPYVMQRTLIGGALESFQIIDPKDANGHFAFEPFVGGNLPFIISQDYNAPRTAGGTLLNQDRIQRKGVGFVSNQPWHDAMSIWQNPMFCMRVPSEVLFSVVFSILPVGIASGVGGVYTVDASASKRVDFAGVVVVGMTMSEQSYDAISRDLQRR